MALFPKIKKLIEKSKSDSGPVRDTTGGIVQKIAQGIKKRYFPKVKDVREAETPGSRFAVSAVQGMNRSFYSIFDAVKNSLAQSKQFKEGFTTAGKGKGDEVMQAPLKISQEALSKGRTIQNQVEADFFGKPIGAQFSVETEGREFREAIPGKGGDQARPGLDKLLGFALGAVEFIPGGGEAAQGIKRASQAIAKVDDVAEIVKQLKTIVKASDDDLLNIAQRVSKISDEKQIEEIITNLGNQTPRAVAGRTPSPQSSFNPRQYVEESIAARESARKGEQKSFVDKAKDVVSFLKRKGYEDLAGIEDAFRFAQKKHALETVPETDITNQLDRVLFSPEISEGFMRRHGLFDIIRSVDDIDEFEKYLIDKRALEISQKIGKETGVDLVKAKQFVDIVGDKYKEQSQVISDYSKALLDRAEEAGLLNSKLVTSLKKNYPDYVPFNRIFSEEELSTVFSGSKTPIGSLSKQDLVQKLEGSTREIESPLHSLVNQTNRVVTQIERNKVAKLVVDELGSLKNNPFGIRKLDDGEKIARKNTISLLRNGEKEIYEVPKEIAAAAKNLDREQMDIITKLFRLPTAVLRLGATALNIPFIVRNLVRDPIFAAIVSDKKFQTSLANPSVFFKGFTEAIGHGDIYKQMLEDGALTTSFDLTRGAQRQTFESIRSGRSAASRAGYLVKNPKEMLRAVEDLVGRSEEVTRIQQYVGTYNAAIKDGVGPRSARIIAARAARENTINFRRAGEWGRVVNSVIPYLNAGIQGSRTLVRAFKNKPLETSAAVVATIILPQATAALWNMAAPERRDVFEDIPEYDKANHIIIIPPNPKKDKDGNWKVIRIPLPVGVGNLADVTRRMFEKAYLDKPFKTHEAFAEIGGTVSPIPFTRNEFFSTMLPQIFKPAWQSVANYNFYYGEPIVPEYMQDLPKEYQVRDSTSATAEKVAKVFNASPIKTEQFIADVGAGTARNLINLSDRMMAAFGIIDKSDIGGRSVGEDIKRSFSRARSGEEQQKEYELIDNVRKEANASTAEIRRMAKDLYEDLSEMEPETAQAIFQDTWNTDKDLAEEVQKLVEKGKLTGPQRAYSSLPNNKAKAQFLYEQSQSFRTPQEKQEWFEDWWASGVISDDVLKKLEELVTQ